MVGSDFLYHIHKRLVEITGRNLPFGGVSILAVGDLFQLPPVGQKQVFEQSPSQISCLWRLFRFFELDEIVRQKDKDFGEFLKRARVNQLIDSDLSLLQSRTFDINYNFPPDSIMIYYKRRLELLDRQFFSLI